MCRADVAKFVRDLILRHHYRVCVPQLTNDAFQVCHWDRTPGRNGVRSLMGRSVLASMFEGLEQIRYQILWILDPDRQPQ